MGIQILMGRENFRGKRAAVAHSAGSHLPKCRDPLPLEKQFNHCLAEIIIYFRITAGRKLMEQLANPGSAKEWPLKWCTMTLGQWHQKDSINRAASHAAEAGGSRTRSSR